jgi:beta-phosphoglucomutase-like phosphatase (HAD superfamily)
MSGNPEFLGAIFDVDDTLLDNNPGVGGRGLHEMSRLAALRQVGKLRGLEKFRTLTPQENLEAFLTAETSNIEGAVWNILTMTGMATGKIDLENELLREIVSLKHQLHEEVLRTQGKEVAGASDFVRMLAVEFDGRLAIASSAIRAEIDIFLEMTGLDEFFTEERIISKEKVAFAKPHPQTYQLAFAALGLPENARRRVLAFEDDPRGVLSAQGAGLFTCAITTRHNREYFSSLAAVPDLIADDFVEFQELLGFAPATRVPSEKFS